MSWSILCCSPRPLAWIWIWNGATSTQTGTHMGCCRQRISSLYYLTGHSELHFNFYSCIFIVFEGREISFNLWFTPPMHEKRIVWIKPIPRCWSSIWVFHIGTRNPSTWPNICVLPGFTLSGIQSVVEWRRLKPMYEIWISQRATSNTSPKIQPHHISIF